MPSPQKLVLFTIIAIAVTLVGTQANGDPAPQYNPTYGPSPSDLYFHFGYTTGSLLANWAFNGNGGSAGTTFTDLSGNGNTGTLYGSDTVTNMAAKGYPAAPVGGGLYFNGATGDRQLHRRAVQLPVQRHERPDRQRVGLFPQRLHGQQHCPKIGYLFALEPERRKPGLAGRLRLHRGAVQLDDVFDRRGL